MQSSHLRNWRVLPGAYVSCYDVLYDVSARGVSLPDGPAAVALFEVECCDEGFLALVFEDDGTDKETGTRTPTELRGGEFVGVLAETEEEMRIVQERYKKFRDAEPAKATLRGIASGERRSCLNFLEDTKSYDDPKVMAWHAYIMNVAKGSADDRSGCGCN